MRTWGLGRWKVGEVRCSLINPKTRDYCLRHVLGTEKKCTLPRLLFPPSLSPNTVNSNFAPKGHGDTTVHRGLGAHCGDPTPKRLGLGWGHSWKIQTRKPCRETDAFVQHGGRLSEFPRWCNPGRRLENGIRRDKEVPILRKWREGGALQSWGLRGPWRRSSEVGRTSLCSRFSPRVGLWRVSG